MNITLLCLTLGLSGTLGHPLPQSADTLEANRRLKRQLLRYYDARWDEFIYEIMGDRGRCSPDDGHECFGGDPDRAACPPDFMCHPYSLINEIIEDLTVASREHPDAGWIVGFTVYTLLKFDRPLEAFDIAQGCEAAEWYCSLLEGYVFHEVGRLDEADSRFHQGLELAPDSITCLLSGASWAMPNRDRRRLDARPCEAQLAASDTIWWFADPLYALLGNDRWTEHVSRSVSTYLFDNPLLYSYPANDHLEAVEYLRPDRSRDLFERGLSLRIPRGVRDSWYFERTEYSLIGGFSTSHKAARYHFVPDFEDGDLSRPIWRLDARMDDEGYTPTYGAFYELPTQIARFRRADSLMVAVAGTLDGSPLAEANEASAYLILSDGPDSFPVQLSSEVHERRAVFLAQTPPERYVASFEILSELGMGRHRQMLGPLATQGPGVSDLLLYELVGDHEPDSLLIAAGMMLGEAVLEPGDRPGVYWETYGAGAGEPVTFELEVRREGGGILDRVVRMVSGGEEGRGRLSWTEPSPGPVFRNAVVLDLEGLGEGRYVLRLRASWPGQESLETERAFAVR
jgi:hypothetical protein